MKTVGIIGGGASALMCACFAPKNVEVTILEKNGKVGKKILATGNGRCNLTNKNMNKYSYNADISSYLKHFSQSDVIKFFSQIGLEVYADDEGRFYPLSNSATTVLDVLLNYLKTKPNINFCTDCNVVDLKKEGNKFEVILDNGVRTFDEVVVALGNYADMHILEKFNVKIIPFSPSLCALKTHKNKTLAGVRVSDVLVKCKEVGFEQVGEILFREDGISGIVIFNLSAYLARKQKSMAEIVLDLLPNVSYQDLVIRLKSRKDKFKNYIIDDFLTGFFIKQVNFELLKQSKLNLNNKVENLTESNLKELAFLIKNYRIQATGFLNNNQVCCGGVCLESLDENLQAKNCKGLFFAGEIVNVDGVCGGYNLQWAWTSGKIVGENL